MRRCLLILTASLCAGFAVPASAEAMRACAVSAIEGGEASLWRGGSHRLLGHTDTVQAHDRIVTGPRTRIEIVCNDGTEISIGAATDIDLGQVLGPAEDGGFAARLFRGISGFVMPALRGGRFEVRTPSAVASVRSTEWAVIVEDGATAVFVREGAVSVLAQSGGGLLRNGDGIDVTAEGTAGPVKQWGAKRVEATKARLGFGWQ